MDDSLALRLKEVRASYDETVEQLSAPDVMSDQDRYRDIARRHSELKPVVDAFASYEAAEQERAEALEMASGETDAEMVSYLEGVAKDKGAELQSLEAELRRLLVPQ